MPDKIRMVHGPAQGSRFIKRNPERLPGPVALRTRERSSASGFSFLFSHILSCKRDMAMTPQVMTRGQGPCL
jgi:hypothetical protein